MSEPGSFTARRKNRRRGRARLDRSIGRDFLASERKLWRQNERETKRKGAWRARAYALGDGERPLAERQPLDRVVAALREASDHLLVREHRAQRGAPVDLGGGGGGGGGSFGRSRWWLGWFGRSTRKRGEGTHLLRSPDAASSRDHRCRVRARGRRTTPHPHRHHAPASRDDPASLITLTHRRLETIPYPSPQPHAPASRTARRAPSRRV